MIIFLYGGDTFRSRKKLREFRDKFLREIDPAGHSLTFVDGESLSMEKISGAIGPSSLLSSKRMVVIERLFANKGKDLFPKILDFLKERGGKDNIILLWDEVGAEDKMIKEKKDLFDFLRKQKYAAMFNNLSNAEIADWVKKEVQEKGGKISASAAAMFSGLWGSDLWQIDNEINKLVNHKLGSKPMIDGGDASFVIEARDLGNAARGHFDENVFALTDAVGSRNKAAAARIMEEQIEAGLSDIRLLGMIARQFKILLRVRQALDSGQTSRKIISILKIHPFVAQKSITQARNFSLPVLKIILKKVLDMEYAFKTGRAEVRVMLDLFIATI